MGGSFRGNGTRESFMKEKRTIDFEMVSIAEGNRKKP
jgi:hypothetical protein